MTKIVATRQAEAATPAPIAIGAPSPAARALAFERGANIDSLMSQLRLALVEIRHAVEAMIALTPPDEAGAAVVPATRLPCSGRDFAVCADLNETRIAGGVFP